MDSDEDQQALAWQQIIRNKAFDNVRVRRGESWVDAACRTLDELIDQKEQAENATPKVVWRERALEAERYLMEARRERDAAVSRDDIDRALINVISNAMNYPTPSQMLGKDTGPLRRKCVDAVCALFGIETEPTDPAEAKARELWEIGKGISVNIEFDDIAPDHRAEYLRIARHLLGQEDRHVDQ